MCLLALKVGSLEQWWGMMGWGACQEAPPAPPRLLHCNEAPRGSLCIEVGEALCSQTFAPLTSQKCGGVPHLVPLAATFCLVLVLSDQSSECR